MKINNLEITKKEKSILEIRGEIDVTDFEASRTGAIKKLAEHLEIDGFRKGKAPEDMVIKKLGEQIILEEMAQTTLSKAYPKILMDHKIDAIGYPQISITKLAKGNPLGFTIMTAVIPEFTLPNYTSIAKKVNGRREVVTISNEEFENFLKQIKRAKAHDDFHKKNPDVQGHDHTPVPDENLPELDLAYVKTLGDFKDIEDFTTKVREDILRDKELKAKEKEKIEIIESIEKETTIDIPEILITSETEKMIARMKSDIERMGLKYEDYLKSLSKTDEDIRKEFKSDAEKRAKVQMIVGEIAIKENLKPDPEKLKAEMKKVMDAYKDADENQARMYIESVMVNEEVFTFLEHLK